MTARGPAGSRPRYARLVAAGSALAVTAVTLLAGTGVLPTGGSQATAAAPGGARLSGVTLPDAARRTAPAATPAPATGPAADPAGVAAEPPAVPAGSGRGRRVVFDIGDQRVWLVGERSRVLRTYEVSGSLTDNLRPGTYEVYSRSRHAVGIDDSGTMEFFVRFTRGTRAAIGFHSIPVKDGRAVQTKAQLGTPRSHGCVRQARADARRLWRFAPLGTTVVVTG